MRPELVKREYLRPDVDGLGLACFVVGWHDYRNGKDILMTESEAILAFAQWRAMQAQKATSY